MIMRKCFPWMRGEHALMGYDGLAIVLNA